MKKNLLILSIIVILIAVAYGAYYMVSRRQDTTVDPRYFPKNEVVIKDYVLGGQVSEIIDNRLILNVQLSTTTKAGIVTTNEVKVAIVGSSTQFFATKYANRKYTKTGAKLSDVKVGDRVSMYSNNNIAEMKSFVPYRIDINK